MNRGGSRPRPRRLWLLFAFTASNSACVSSPCQEVVQRTCGVGDPCRDEESCLSAKELLANGVAAACAAALDNELGYPACKN